MTETVRLSRIPNAQVSGSDLIKLWSSRYGGNVALSLNQMLDYFDNKSTLSSQIATADANASAAVSTANGAAAAAGAAVTTANNANAAVVAQQPWVDSLATGVVSSGPVPIAATWSRKLWTNAEVYDPRAGGPGGAALADLPSGTYPIGNDAEGFVSITLPNGGQVTAKNVTKRSKANDILVSARFLVTGTSGNSTGYVGVFYGQEGAATAARTRMSQPLVEGVNYLNFFIPKSSLFQATLIRPMARRAGTDGIVQLQNLQVIEMVNGILPLLAFNPPTNGTSDCKAFFDQAIAATANISNSVKILDGLGLTYALAAPVENNVSGTSWRNMNLQAIGTRASFAGGTTDSRGVATQKGLIRRRADNQNYENVNIHCGEYEAIPIVTANSVYTEYRTLCNGFEDAQVGAGNKAKVAQFRYCFVQQFDDYGYRYASDTGGGFDLIESRANKQAGSPFRNADQNRGACLILDANDGFVHKCTFFGGEYQIWQKSGGTILLSHNHPWQGVSAYQRAYFGPAGVPIETGVQTRVGGIGNYDAGLVTVTRRPEDWMILVTPIATITQANATVVRIRRDEINAFMEGWGSTWIGNYVDGGTIRVNSNGHIFKGTYGLVGALTDTDAEFPVSNLVSMYEYRPGSNASTPPYAPDGHNPSWGKRMIMYPRSGQTSFSANNLLYGTDALEDWGGRYSDATFRTYSRGAGGVVEEFTSSGSSHWIKLGSILIGSGSGSPEGVHPAPLGSQFMRTNGAAGTTMYVKETGTGNTGWVAK